MGYSKNYSSQPSSGGFAQKVKNVASLVGTVKSIYDTEKTIYSAAQAAAPYIEMAAGLI